MVFSFLEYLFSFERYLRFCKESDDVIGDSTRTAQHSVESGSGDIKAEFFRLGTGGVHQKKKKHNDTCCAIAMTTVMLLVLF